MDSPAPPAARPRPSRRALLEVLAYGAGLGLLTLALDVAGYRFLGPVGPERSVQLYATAVGVVFAAVGIWLGARIWKREPAVIVREVPAPAEPFARDERRLAELGITPRELEILELIAAGLSNREIGARLFVSENTVKTHASRVFDKLGARRRTEAVQLAKEARVIP
jgi:two-component system, NarL family, response regulator LiaR